MEYLPFTGLYLQLSHNTQLIAVQTTLPRPESQQCSIPAFSHLDGDDIIARVLQKGSDIENLVVQMMLVARPSGCHAMVTHLFAVDESTIHALAGDV
jgi:hypothetical protein